MFVLKKNGSYTWPVNFSIPSDGGKHEKKTFELNFKRISQTKLKEYLEKIEKEKASDEDFCREVITGWKGIQDEDGNEISFSESALDELLDFPVLAKEIVTTYIKSLDGAKVKN